MIHTRVRTSEGHFQTDVAAEDLHGLLEDQGSLVWLDLESPSPEELALIGGILKWEHLTIEDLTKQGQRGKLEQFTSTCF